MTLASNTLAAVPSPASRQAALLLHGVAEADRKWLLGALSAPQRSRLDRLLDELRRLGVPPSPELIDDLLLGSGPSPGAVAEDRPATAAPGAAAALRLSQVAPATLAAALHPEADALVARVLRIASDPQRQAVLRKLGSLRRRRVEEGARAPAPAGEGHGERLQCAILDAVLRRNGDATRSGFGTAVARCLAVARRARGGPLHRSPGARP